MRGVVDCMLKNTILAFIATFISTLVLSIFILFSSTVNATASSIASANSANEPQTKHSTSTYLNDYNDYLAVYNLYLHGSKGGTQIQRIKKVNNDRFLAESVLVNNLYYSHFKSMETTEFKIQQGNFIPINYNFETRDSKINKKGTLEFKENAQKYEHKNEQKLALQNKLTFLLQLRQDLLNAKNNAKDNVKQSAEKKEFHYSILEPEGIKQYHLISKGYENIKTVLGKHPSLKIEHASKDNFRTVFWFAEDLDYLLVKVQQYHKGHLVAESKITSYGTKNIKSSKWFTLKDPEKLLNIRNFMDDIHFRFESRYPEKAKSKKS